MPEAVELPDVLTLSSRTATLSALVRALIDAGATVDSAMGLDEARSMFLERGGHGLLVLGPDLPPGLAAQAAASLRGLDPELSIIVFGRELLRDQPRRRITRIRELHPTSRAGIGGVLKAVRALQ